MTEEYELYITSGVGWAVAQEHKCCGNCKKGESEGRKFDGEKPRWDLLPYDIVEQAVKVLTFGARKYDDWNWQKLEDGDQRYFAAMMRHIAERRKGNSEDPETGLPHLAHALVSLIFYMWHDENMPELE